LTIEFIFKGNKALSGGELNINDLPSSGGRMDLICRCISSAFFLSHNIREDTIFYSVHYGAPNPPVALKFVGKELKRVSPDERSIALFIKKALEKNPIKIWKKSTDGIYIAKKDFKELILEKKQNNYNIYYLHKEGKPIEDIFNNGNIDINNSNNINSNNINSNILFVLGDHIGIGEEDEYFLENEIKATKISLSPVELHANHCITIVHNVLDKLKEKNVKK